MSNPHAGHEPDDGSRRGSQLGIDALRQVASGIAHEFANSLTAIAGIAHLMQSDGAAGQQARDDLDEIQQITQEAAFLARELMAFASDRPAEPGRRWLSELVTELRRILPHVLPRNVRLAERPVENDIEVWTNPRQIVDVSIALAVNIRDRLPRGGELLVQTRQETVEDVAAAALGTPPGSYGILAIATAGPLSDAPRASSPPAAEALADAARILRESAGALAIHDDSDGHRHFTIYLPIAAAAAGASPGASGRGGTETILLLEEEDELARILARLLQARGYTVLHARDANAAVTFADTHGGAIHLLLADAAVRGPAGLEDVLHRFRAARPDARVLFMSADGHRPPGGLPFLPKPFEAAALSQKVRAVLDSERRPRT